MKHFYFIKSVSAWVNLMHVVSIYRENTKWVMSLDNEKTYRLNDDEYVELLNKLSHKEEKREPKE